LIQPDPIVLSGRRQFGRIVFSARGAKTKTVGARLSAFKQREIAAADHHLKQKEDAPDGD
jgi:hypothetical protein